MDIRLRLFLPVGVFVSALCIALLLWATIDSGAATLVAGLMTSVATGFVGWAAYRGLVVPVTAQRDIDRRTVAHLLMADLLHINGQVLQVRFDINDAAELDPPDQFRIRFTATDSRFHTLELKAGIFPVHTVIAICDAYRLVPTPETVARWNETSMNPERALDRLAVLEYVQQYFKEFEAAVDKAINTLAKYASHE